MIKSKLLKAERVDNKDRRFGSEGFYFPCLIERRSGAVELALFTKSQLDVALARGAANPEDASDLVKP